MSIIEIISHLVLGPVSVVAIFWLIVWLIDDDDDDDDQDSGEPDLVYKVSRQTIRYHQTK